MPAIDIVLLLVSLLSHWSDPQSHCPLLAAAAARFVDSNVRENQMLAYPECMYGAVTLTCDTSSCSLSFQPVNWLTLKYNVMYQVWYGMECVV